MGWGREGNLPVDCLYVLVHPNLRLFMILKRPQRPKTCFCSQTETVSSSSLTWPHHPEPSGLHKETVHHSCLDQKFLMLTVPLMLCKEGVILSGTKQALSFIYQLKLASWCFGVCVCISNTFKKIVKSVINLQVERNKIQSAIYAYHCSK